MTSAGAEGWESASGIGRAIHRLLKTLTCSLQGLCQDVLSEMPKGHNKFWGEGQVSDYLVVDMKGSSVLT